ncbi:Kinase superfamily protein, putative [Theobroma cacao]|uniref:Kinase superfamily protein, putative n=1 Tax=Theobroma cacao TaxID=3641 RepID=A0A061EB92_THECC|nr:Kinase superfamily protein, putative [Theobroma cacao]
MRRQTVSNFPAKAKAAFYVLTASGLCYQAASHSNFLPFSPDTSVFQGLLRSSRAIFTIAVTVADYKYSLYGLPKDCDECRLLLSEVHLRSAKRMLKLCEMNKGFYLKAGQFVASLRQVPKEYSLTLSSLQDQAVPCDFKVIKETIISNLGQDLSKIFIWFNEQPIAAASIAQVHHAMLKDRQEVAVKVQYPGLEKKMKLDTRIMHFVSKSVAWFFPEYRFGWLVSEFTKAVSMELDFIQEARNSETIANSFKKNKIVRVPHVFWEFTTKQVLTMQFCSGHKVDDVEFLKGMKIDPVKVAKALVEVFAEMIFIHGFLHGDPHPGNILVSPEGRDGFSLVLLDHGICKKLNEEFRLEYCQLWKALILLDSKMIQHLGERFGVGKYSRYFPVMFTGRTIDSKSGLGKEMLVEEKKKLKQDLKSLKMEDLSSFMESLPSDFLMILRTDELLRSIISKLGASKRVRLQTYGKYASHGLSRKLNPCSDLTLVVLFARLIGNIQYIHLKLALGVMELVFWMGKLKQSFNNFYKKMSGSGKSLLTLFFNIRV